MPWTGPFRRALAILPMTALRALRAGEWSMVATLGRSTRVFSLASLLVAVLGFGVVGTADERFGLSVTTGWVLTSIILYLAALALSLALVAGRTDASPPAPASCRSCWSPSRC